jgi:EAL domain-containing protein (putative c-di-GMP-specific phosphodiesterase class I)
VGFEALLRCRMPNGRIGMPGALEAAFEEPDVAAEISDRMIDRVIADMRGWLSRGVPFQHVAVNASAAEFRRENFAERVIEQLGRADIPTRCFQLEVTETQERRLMELKCDFGQGFLFSRAVAARHVPRLIRQWPDRAVGVPSKGDLRLVAAQLIGWTAHVPSTARGPVQATNLVARRYR